jgi:NADH dehydrogenase FAD-containing subunit
VQKRILVVGSGFAGMRVALPQGRSGVSMHAYDGRATPELLESPIAGSRQDRSQCAC